MVDVRKGALAWTLAGVLLAGGAVPRASTQASGVAMGRELYEARCAACHGMKGRGDGPVAATLQPRPGDHTNERVMSALTDDFLFQIIRGGGAVVGRSTKMPAAAARLSDREVRNLIAFIRSIATGRAPRSRAIVPVNPATRRD